MLARAVAEDFRAYRKAQGKLTLTIWITWRCGWINRRQASALPPAALVRHPRRGSGQTSLQFHVLPSSAGASGSTAAGDMLWQHRLQRPTVNRWRVEVASTTSSPPAPSAPPAGRFCMVGDPSKRSTAAAPIYTYRNVHEALLHNRPRDALHFTVTMRCDSAIVDTANAVFLNLLREDDAELAGGSAQLAAAPDVVA